MNTLLMCLTGLLFFGLFLRVYALQLVNPLVITGAIVSVLSGVGAVSHSTTATPPMVQLGLDMLKQLVDTLTDACGSLESAVSGLGRVLLSDLASQLSHACYRKNWKLMLGGCEGIAYLTATLPRDWVIKHKRMLLTACFFVLRDHTAGASPAAISCPL